jgi:hypothetical protein
MRAQACTSSIKKMAKLVQGSAAQATLALGEHWPG